MANMNLLVALNTYSDANASNNPNLSNFKWSRDIVGFPVSNPVSQVLTLAPGASVTIFTSAAKKFVYVESDFDVNLAINGGSALTLKPYVINTSKVPGTFMLKSAFTALVITNPSGTDTANVFVAHAE